ncbi:putative dUTPase [Erwinia phage vB_EamM_Y3]|uniref:dUTP diphosphatase n=1 Tax=Erwinia phage vB_EamM_Y3 TaxID=1983553 RepID=A0A2H4IBR2_9CAUD|nr:putative dUTPase [Erwinia phage vB_EamM_Y3]ARW58940.1 putative dUTPase [Erwinia phage vB_EamM_Y3]QZE56160.1 hypothetical protein pEaSNUABM52_00302 [Erwinia phage pEp_SNUABM_52]
MQFLVKPDLNRYPDFIVPKRGSAQAAGIDLFAQQDMIITADTELFDLGFQAAVPDGYVAIIFPRSGLGAKFNVQLSNTTGVIDSDYRGEWKAAIHLGGKGTQVDQLDWLSAAYLQSDMDEFPDLDDDEDQKALLIKRGEAYAQVLFFEVPLMEVALAEELPDTERGDGGFGSTTAPRV